MVKPVIEPLFGVPLPSDSVLGEIENIYHQLDEMKAILSDRETTTIRIVVNPEKMVIKEAQRSFTYLNIYDYNVDAIVVNRVIPERIVDKYFTVWKDIQKRYKTVIEESFRPIPIYEAPLFEQEIVGLDMLKRLGDAIFKDENPVEIKYSMRTQSVSKEADHYVMKIFMPFTDKQDLTLNQKGDELIVKVGQVKRNISLPRTLMNLSVQGAKFEEDQLTIQFGGGAVHE